MLKHRSRLAFAPLFPLLAALVPACAGSAPDVGAPTGPGKITDVAAATSADPAPAKASSSAEPAAASQGATEKRPVVIEYHGTRVTDDYQWLEDSKSPDVKAWTSAQNQKSRAYFDAVSDRPRIHKRFTEIFAASSADRFAP